MIKTSLIILGSGYTADFVRPHAGRRYAKVLFTSRAPDKHLSHLSPERRVKFDLMQPDTWTQIPTDADLLWCFPAEPMESVRRFAETVKAAARRVVVLGSTSAYLGDSHEYPPSWIDETAPIDLSQPRVQGEEYLRKECGAIVLRVAGIYGPGRNPIDWIKNGRIGPSQKYVNLVHVEDLAAACLAALEGGKFGEIYNVSDGTPRTWEGVCATVQTRCDLIATATSGDPSVGKRIDTRKLTHELGVRIRHPDLFAALEELRNVEEL